LTDLLLFSLFVFVSLRGDVLQIPDDADDGSICYSVFTQCCVVELSWSSVSVCLGMDR